MQAPFPFELELLETCARAAEREGGSVRLLEDSRDQCIEGPPNLWTDETAGRSRDGQMKRIPTEENL